MHLVQAKANFKKQMMLLKYVTIITFSFHHELATQEQKYGL